HFVIVDIYAIQHGEFWLPLLMLTAISIGVGYVISFIAGSVPARQVRKAIEGMNRLAEGKYDTRLDLGNSELGKDVSESFNKLAYELEHTEMLRSDFVNNFSHEFKTPIVSVLGFAKLLKRENLSEEHRMEYLEIIEEESGRLSVMATNVLNLTKIENQTILTDVTEFNLSEQIRNCVLLLEKKWAQKGLPPSLEFQEYQISANEELLKQVWINLLDNAIKYSPEGETIEIGIYQEEDATAVSVINYGPKIQEKDLPLIMNKFYQADTSHASEGNGLGLAIVSRIITLHGGTVDVESSDEETIFTVTLPKL
ncbi:MAG: HAMP domain-containing histidine kinase, partial [Lachnospiraceae bacterium]|nr:HAMP domain-containing histidine kinase [Lachnospiraceae bacterium]